MFTQIVAIAALIVAARASPLRNRDSNDKMAQSWRDIPPSADLKFTPCFDNYTCVNLEVPLDYQHTDVGTTNVAFIKWNSPNPDAIDIIFNPGGPGESGVEFVRGRVALLQNLLGDQYNIVGMDPRGVNNSGPNTDCFVGRPATRDFYANNFLQVDAHSQPSIDKYYAESGGYGTWCSNALNETARYANTPATARDMLQYAELLDESKGKPRGEALVHFYGASYGSTLGTTFAAMFPDRVGRFLIDAVVDVEDHYFGNWSQNLLQADESIVKMFSLCAEAGPICPLFQNGSTPESIVKRLDNVLQNLEDQPIAVPDPTFVQFPTTVTHMDLRVVLLTTGYAPAASFPLLAQIVADLENKNGTLLAVYLQKGLMAASECDNRSPPSLATYPKWIIACNDNNRRWEVTEQSVTDLFTYNQELSSYIGGFFTTAIIPQCRNLHFQPPSNQIFDGFKKTKTRTPLLFTGNTLDPLSSSHEKMSAFFEGSGIFLQDAIGHGLAATTSNCTNEIVRTYFATAEIPPPGTVCETNFEIYASAEVGEGVARRGLGSIGLSGLGF